MTTAADGTTEVMKVTPPDITIHDNIIMIQVLLISSLLFDASVAPVEYGSDPTVIEDADNLGNSLMMVITIVNNM